MTNTFPSVPTFSLNRFNYHDRTLEDKRGNDLARLSGEGGGADPLILHAWHVQLQFHLYFFLVFSHTK